MRIHAKHLVLAVLVAVLLLTGAFNLRSTFWGGSTAGHTWAIDPTDQSSMDALVDAPVRLPAQLDDQIISLQDELRDHPNNGQAAVMLGQAYLQKARETGDPSYYPKAEELFTKAWKLDDQDFAAATGLGTLALARHDFTKG